MTTDFHKHQLQIKILILQENLKAMEAEKAGQPIQGKSHTSDEWVDVESVSFPITGQYRVKPEPPKKPRVVFINEYSWGFGDHHHQSEEQASKYFGNNKIRTVKFVEDLGQ